MNEQTMVERVVDAVKAELGRQLSAKPLLGDKASGDWYTDADSAGSIDLDKMVRVGVAAMRDPPESVVDAGRAVTVAYLKIPGSGLTVAREKMRRRWNGMIDAVTKQP